MDLVSGVTTTHGDIRTRHDEIAQERNGYGDDTVDDEKPCRTKSVMLFY